MKSIFLSLVFLFGILTVSAQGTVKAIVKQTCENAEIDAIMSFENLFSKQLTFEGSALKGKQYQVFIEEFKDGKLLRTDTLFDGTEDEYFRLKSDNTRLKFFFKIANGKLKTALQGNGFSSKKFYFDLLLDSDQYTVKDLSNKNNEMQLYTDRKTPIFAIIPPTIHKDGSGSYCEVVRAAGNPRELGIRFKLPQYFLISIAFK